MGRKTIPPTPEGIPETVVVTDTLDLHGFFPEQIPEIMEAFIHNAQDLGLIRVRVIHGKGKSRLKFEVIRFLKDDPRVIRFGDAPPDLGGWGSTVAELHDPSGPLQDTKSRTQMTGRRKQEKKTEKNIHRRKPEGAAVRRKG